MTAKLVPSAVAQSAKRQTTPFANYAALTALKPSRRVDGMIVRVAADQSLWSFDAASTLEDTSGHFVRVPDVGTGRWVRLDKTVALKLAVGFGTADAAVLFTVPAGMRFWVLRAGWEVTTAFTGGTSATIGLSSSATQHSTKGDLQGGAAGDALAALTQGFRGGTVGADLANNGLVLLIAGDTIRFDRITSAFGAGAGFAHVLLQQAA